MTQGVDLSRSERRLVKQPLSIPELEVATTTSTSLAGPTGTSCSIIDRSAREFSYGGYTRRRFLVALIFAMGASKLKARRIGAYRWVTANGGDVPVGAAAQGHEANGELLYVCRAYYRGGLHPGKVKGQFGAANIPYGGLEVQVNPYEVLLDEGTWVTASGGHVPVGAVAWGHEANGEALYVCRAYYGGGLHPGKVKGQFGAANIPYRGRELQVNPYEVLVGGFE
jgi:hypothetical protein